MAIIFDSEQQQQVFARLLEAVDTVPVSGPLGEVRRFADELAAAKNAVATSRVAIDPTLEGLADR